MVISETNFKNILIWDDLVLNSIYGKDISFNNFDDEKELRNIVQIMDWLQICLMHYLRLSKSYNNDLIRSLYSLLSHICMP